MKHCCILFYIVMLSAKAWHEFLPVGMALALLSHHTETMCYKGSLVFLPVLMQALRALESSLR